jgi:hypothetical protein
MEVDQIGAHNANSDYSDDCANNLNDKDDGMDDQDLQKVIADTETVKINKNVMMIPMVKVDCTSDRQLEVKNFALELDKYFVAVEELEAADIHEGVRCYNPQNIEYSADGFFDLECKIDSRKEGYGRLTQYCCRI